ncbi:MAG TPA: acyltransferase [Acidobacteriaceae bacterium]
MRRPKFLSSSAFKLVPHQGARSIELDFVRGIAILLVMGLHFVTVPTRNPLFLILQYPGKRFGGAGVDIFFVLSGFLVGGLLMKEYSKTEALDAKRFILRRGLKIWPQYYVFILLEIITHAHPLKTFLWQNLLHVQNYTGSSISHSWSLAVEEHFYLALAFGMGWMVRRKWTAGRMLTVFLLVMAVVFVSRTICFFTLGHHSAFEDTHNRIDSLLCGVILALLFYFFPERFAFISRRKLPLALIVGLVVIFLCTVQSNLISDTIGLTLLYLGAAAFLLLVYSHSQRIRQWLVYRIIAAIGVYSYAIYLYQNSIRYPSLHIAMHFPAPLRWPVLMIFQYSAAILAGVIMTRLVEWPFLRYRDRILPQRVRDIGSPESAQVMPAYPQTSAAQELQKTGS